MTSPRDAHAALADADIPVLLAVLVHLTGDERWIEPPFRPVRDGRLFAEESGGLPPEVQATVRAAVLDALAAADPAGRPLADATIARMLSALVGEPVASEYLEPVLEDIGLREPPLPEPLSAGLDRPSVTIIGGGVSGVCAAIGLARLGVPFTVLEKNPSVGGTWFENVYPEAGVDTPNHFYSFSFAPKRDWTAYFSKQREILAYVEDCVDRFGVRDRIVLGATAHSAHFDAAAQRWTVHYTSADGAQHELDSDVLVTAVGQVNRPKLPAIEGIHRFAGALFHTARWPRDVELDGRRVALVGSGASSVQAARSIAGSAERLTIFQRSPQWIMPNPDYHRHVSPAKQWLLDHVPFYAPWYRFGLFWRYADGVHASLQVDPGWAHPRRSVNAVNDRHRGYLTRYMTSMLEGRPDLLAKSLPDYPPYGKRMVIDNDWFATLRRDNVELITDPITAVTPTGIRTADGREHPLDVIALATGFDATRMLWPFDIVGRGGVSIHERWRGDEPRTYLGMTTPDFPNMFMLFGPTTSLAHGGSALFQIECQVRYLAHCLSRMARSGIKSIECTESASDAYTRAADDAHARLVFSHTAMNNWYKNRAGRVVTVSPWRLVDYWQMTREPDFDQFILEPLATT